MCETSPHVPALVLVAAPALLLAPVCSATAAPLQLYVSVRGNDTWSGRTAAEQGPTGPFATLSRARQEVRALKAAGGLPEGVVVNVLPGTYPLSETFTLGPEDSGAAETPIVYRGDRLQKPVLSGGQVLGGFEPEEGAIIRCDLAANGLAGRRFRQLFHGDRRLILARYPNLDPLDPHGGAWAYVAAAEGDENHREFSYGADEPHNWAHPQDGEVPIFAGYDWAFSTAPLADYDPDQRRITLGADTWGPLRIGDRYVIQGLREELDAPGEWYLDPRTDTLYVWPPDGPADMPVVAPVLDTVVAIQGAEGIILDGLVIEACEGDAVTVTDSRRCLVAGCLVRNCGRYGIVVSGGGESGAQGNDVYECGHGGISISGGDRQTLAPGRNFADNNYLHHCACLWKTYRPGVAVSGVGNRVSHNLIHDMPHAGLLLSGNENVVEYNLVHHVNLESADTGGIYFCSRDWTQRGNVVRYNVFHHCGGFGKTNSWAPVRDGKVEFRYPHFTWGIYLDDPTTGTLVYGNILYRVPLCGLHNHGGRDNTWENNILVDCPAINEGALDPNWSEWPAIFERLNAMRQPGSPYLDRYPELAQVADTHPEEMSGVRFLRNIVYWTQEGTRRIREEAGTDWGGPERMQLYALRMRPEDFARNEWDYNCLYMEPGLEPRVDLTLMPEPRKLLTWQEWQQLGRDTHSELADPGFTDPAKHDYSLRPGSPAFRLGFQPIPIEAIGPYQDDLRASWPIEEAVGAAARGDFTTVRYYEPPEYRRLPAQESVPRDGIPHFAAKAAADGPLRVAYFGGGIHYADGWRGSVLQWLRQRYGEVTEVDAGICDCVRGSGFSVYRFEHDVLAERPDLVLVDFASDDADTDPAAIVAAVEGVVRQAWRADPQLDLVFLLAFREGFEQDYAEQLAPYGVSAYERIAAHYGVPTINMGYRVAVLQRTDRLLISGTPEEAAGRLLFSRDGVRPAEDGNRVYAETITAALDALVAQGGAAQPHTLPAAYSGSNLERARQFPITRQMLTGEWQELAAGDPLAAQFARHMDTLWHTSTPGAKLSFRFRGTAAAVFDLMGPDTGRAQVVVDGQAVGVYQQVDPWAYFQRLAALPVASGLADGVHSVTVELLPDPPDRTVAIEAARRENRYDPQLFEGVAFRLGGLRISGELVEG